MAEVVVEYDYKGKEEDELTIHPGDIIKNVNMMDGGWWEGELNGKRGVFPDNFVKVRETKPSTEPPKSNKVADLQKTLGGIPMGPPPEAILKKGEARTKCQVLFSYDAQNEDELNLTENDIVELIREEEPGWYYGASKGKQGMFPSNFVKVLPTETAAAPNGTEAGERAPKGHKIPPGAVGYGDIFGKAKPQLRSGGEAAPVPQPQTHVSPVKPKQKQEVKAKVLFEYKAQNPDELTLREGEIVTVLDQNLEDRGWWKGEVNGRVGVFPDNFIEIIKEAPVKTEMPKVEVVKPKPAPEPTKPAVAVKKPPPTVPTKPTVQPAQTSRASSQESIEGTADLTQNNIVRPAAPPTHSAVQAPATVDLEPLTKEIRWIKENTVTKDQFRDLQHTCDRLRDELSETKRTLNAKIADLMTEIDEEKRIRVTTEVDIQRLRKLVFDREKSQA